MLVVDDDDGVRLVARLMLERAGFRVVDASSGEAAELALLATPEIELVLTDILMPGENGPALVRRLRGHRPALPVVYFTGDDVPDLQGADPVLVKPFTAADLTATVERCLSPR